MPQARTRLYGLTADEFLDFADTFPSGLVVVLADPRFRLFANPAGHRLLGLPGRAREPIPIRELSETTRIIADDEDYSLANWLINQLDRRRAGRRADVSLIRGQAPSVDLLAVVNCLGPDSTGRRGCVVTLMDVSGERWLGKQLAQRAAQQSLAARYGNALLVKADARAAMQRACETIARGLNFELAFFMTINEEKRTLVVEATSDTSANPSMTESDVPLAPESLVAKTWLQRCTQVSRQPESLSPPAACTGRFESGVATPVWIAEEPRAVLAAFSTQTASLHEQDIGFVENIGMMASNGLSRILAEDRYLRSVRQLERARATQRIDRAARLASLGTMVSGIAHEVKNPINAIHMNAELAGLCLERGDKLQEARECMSRIQADCRRAAAIADGILSFALGKEAHDLETVPLCELFAGVSRLAANIPGVQKGMLDINVESPELAVEVSRTDFEQAVLNLVQNSFEAGASAVSLTARPASTGLEIEVDDDGPGIPEDLLARVFDPFFTTRDGSGGSGLGLSLAHRIVTDHGGHIDVDSEPGKGCRFTISLPVAFANEHS